MKDTADTLKRVRDQYGEGVADLVAAMSRLGMTGTVAKSRASTRADVDKARRTAVSVNLPPVRMMFAPKSDIYLTIEGVTCELVIDTLPAVHLRTLVMRCLNPRHPHARLDDTLPEAIQGELCLDRGLHNQVARLLKTGRHMRLAATLIDFAGSYNHYNSYRRLNLPARCPLCNRPGTTAEMEICHCGQPACKDCMVGRCAIHGWVCPGHGEGPFQRLAIHNVTESGEPSGAGERGNTYLCGTCLKERACSHIRDNKPSPLTPHELPTIRAHRCPGCGRYHCFVCNTQRYCRRCR